MTNSFVSNKAKIGKHVTIKNFSVIEDDVEIGDNVEIGSNALVADGARISSNVKIHHGAVIATIPQDLKFDGESTVIREYATLNRGTSHSKKTVIGKNCFIMAYAHVAHDCRIGNNVIIANAVQMGGHVEIGDSAIIGGSAVIHQFTKIGNFVMVGGGFRVVKDLPPFILAGGYPLKYEGVNVIGLRRKGFTNEQINNIRNAYDEIYHSSLNVGDAVKKIKETFEMTDEIKNIVSFIEASERGIVKG
ncbi:MAG: acyl-ACP--UDP-N-acetylglucosamine O-acyltransferase [bacterium]